MIKHIKEFFKAKAGKKIAENDSVAYYKKSDGKIHRRWKIKKRDVIILVGLIVFLIAATYFQF